MALLKGKEGEEEEELFSTEELEQIAKRQGVFATSRVGDRILGVTKTLCLVSRFNFGNSFKPFLEFLEAQCFREGRSIPIERSVSLLHEFLVNTVNLPPK